MIKISPVILCGGSGTRLWPLSRANFPKQFLAIEGKPTLFQQAVERLLRLSKSDFSFEPISILGNEQHRFLIKEQLIPFKNNTFQILLEPSSRNTAPAITFAALQAQDRSASDSILIITPSDHNISNIDKFLDAITNAIHLADQEHIVVFGTEPEKPETAYGYIKKSNSMGDFNGFDVIEFVEKPEKLLANSYFKSQSYYWNSGIFVVKVSVWLRAIQKFRPDIFKATSLAFQGKAKDGSFIRPDKELFNIIPADSIDFAVMEHCVGTEFSVKLVELDVGWNDLGTWNSVFNISQKDQHQNVLLGDVITKSTSNSLVHSTSRLVATVGIDNLIVIETPDAVLVLNRDKDLDIKHIVSQLKQLKREEIITHRKVNRPWGWYDTIDIGGRFKVKRIQVNPGASLSLQKHEKRAEHWIVVKGLANVVCGQKTFTIKENESTFIPLGELHQLSNPADIPLEIIEIQSGSYVGEDDIVRLKDDYDRREG